MVHLAPKAANTFVGFGHYGTKKGPILLYTPVDVHDLQGKIQLAYMLKGFHVDRIWGRVQRPRGEVDNAMTTQSFFAL